MSKGHTDKPTFRQAIINNTLPQPNSPKFSIDKWKQFLVTHGASDADVKLFHFGEFIYGRLEELRTHCDKIGINGQDKTSAMKIAAGLINIAAVDIENKKIESIALAAKNNSDPSSAARNAFFQGKLTDDFGDEIDPENVFEAMIASFKYVLSEIYSLSDTNFPANIQSIKSLFTISSFYNFHIDAWKGILFDYYIYDTSGSKINIKFKNETLARQREISLVRRMHDTTTKTAELIPKIHQTTSQIVGFDSKTKKPVVREAQDYETAYIITSITKGSEHYKLFFNERLATAKSATLSDALIVYSKLAGLKMDLSVYYTSLPKPADAKGHCNYAIEIDTNLLINLLHKITKITKDRLDEIINIFSFTNSSKIDPASKFFIKLEKTIIPIIATMDTNIEFFIPTLLDFKDIELKKKGKIFENYLYEELKKTDVDYDLTLSPGAGTIFQVDSHNEEIDLFFVFGTDLYICEAKNTVYPDDYSKIYNYYRLVQDAALQIKRKENFIKNNLDIFLNKYFPNKKISNIYSIVISNQLEYSGECINGVQIVDSSSFLVYFKYDRPRIIHSGNDIDENILTYLEKQRYFDSKKQAYNNFQTYLKELPQNSIVKQSTKIIEKDYPDLSITTQIAMIDVI